MSGGGGKAMGTVLVVGGLILFNILSWVFDWGWTLF